MTSKKRNGNSSRIFKILKRITLGLLSLVVLALLLRILFFQGAFLPPSPLPTKPILDMHCHTAGIGSGESGCFISDELRDSYKFKIYLKSFGVSLNELEELDDSILFERISRQIEESQYVGGAIILAMDGIIKEDGELDRELTEVYVPNDFVARETAKYENLYFGASINPYREDAIEQLEQAKANGALLVKWLPSIQFIDPADEAIIPFYEKLIELDLPLLTHAGQEKSFTHARDELADPERLILPLELGVKVIVAHIASTGKNEGERDTDRLREMMDDYPNLFSEISSLTQINKLGYLKEALTETAWDGRLMYGSDFPLINTPLVSSWNFPLNLTFREMFKIASIENAWDRDIELKHALGIPTEIFAKPREFFGIESLDQSAP